MNERTFLNDQSVKNDQKILELNQKLAVLSQENNKKESNKDLQLLLQQSQLNKQQIEELKQKLARVAQNKTESNLNAQSNEASKHVDFENKLKAHVQGLINRIQALERGGRGGTPEELNKQKADAKENERKFQTVVTTLEAGKQKWLSLDENEKTNFIDFLINLCNLTEEKRLRFLSFKQFPVAEKHKKEWQSHFELYEMLLGAELDASITSKDLIQKIDKVLRVKEAEKEKQTILIKALEDDEQHKKESIKELQRVYDLNLEILKHCFEHNIKLTSLDYLFESKVQPKEEEIKTLKEEIKSIKHEKQKLENHASRTDLELKKSKTTLEERSDYYFSLFFKYLTIF